MDGTWTLALPEREETVAGDATDRLGRLFDAHHRRLFALACRMTGDREDARDLVQETFVRAAGAQSIPENAEAWLVQVLIHLCRDRRRHQRVQQRHAAELATPEGVVSNPDLDLWRAVNALPPRQRAAIVLHEVEGHAVVQVAALLGVSPVTVRWHLLAGRRRLREVLR
ncbi:MAG TPA: sigma-70 family RNA polymerase sigma factor [Candidatus Polarisedimenticolaceae bacterium]|nr:sigma-70 family RNA polymerase sigma factor [Candidatus Polarisedimenticolaceae bacterium]